MSRGSGKKQKHHAKRQERKRMQHRQQVGSPYQRIGRTAGPVECYITQDWKTRGMAAILVRKETPADGGVLVALLVDLWCIGLKGAWGRIGVSRSEFEQALQRGPERDRVDLALVKRLVAGGVRFARQNGFRLPPHYERWLKVIGGVGDTETADLSDFGVDGGLRYTGTIEGLREKLVGCRVEDFLARPDVQYILGPPPEYVFDAQDGDAESEYQHDHGDDDPDDDDPPDNDDASDNDDEAWDDEEEPDPIILANMRRTVNVVRAQMIARAHQWCADHHEIPHPRFDDAIAAVSLVFLGTGTPADCKDPARKEEVLSHIYAQLLAEVEPAVRLEIASAFEQVKRFLSQWTTMEEALGIRMP